MKTQENKKINLKLRFLKIVIISAVNTILLKFIFRFDVIEIGFDDFISMTITFFIVDFLFNFLLKNKSKNK